MTNNSTAAITAEQVERFRLESIKRAEAALAQYPQYRGHWNDHQVVEVKRRIRTKLGLAFTRGEWTIAKVFQGDPSLGLDGGSVSAWSFSNRCDTVIAAADVVWVAAAN
jgi:hypothetical protein